MARARSVLAPLAIVACLLLAAPSFVPPQAPLRDHSSTAAAAAAAAMAPAAAHAAEYTDAVDLDSSLNLSGSVEILMIGIVLGTVPTTMLGLFVSAWLQFKKGPTLGL
eukprot:TRINITY_DN513_c0_g2_i1.p1 TRINITY_DN513_c0_g2~~TRINITY_DN513_c0_g2_i1.p1  ORF type:complete len:126 (+),score=29.32 TRINITY_DN513_c0_g2_i1:56-379(+)